MIPLGRVSANDSLDFQLHSIGWKAFQDLCLTILGDQLSQSVKRFAVVRDGGRDGAFVGKWHPSPGLEISGETVIQCKFTNRRDKSLTSSAFSDETSKAAKLWRRRKRENYVLLTNYRVTAEFEEATSRRFQRFGCRSFHAFGNEWITSSIQKSARLRTLIPRLYGLGDLSQIMDERWYVQTRKLLEAEKENLRKFVPTRSYRRAVESLNKHGFVLLLGEPAVGKSAIAATLSLAAGDAWQCRPMKLEHASEIRERWNPEDPKQLFWIDDAFGTTQYDSNRVQEWNSLLPWLKPVLDSGSRLVLTSRDYIYSRARRELKQSSFPLLRESQVVVDVADLSLAEREQILYNHIRMGTQSRKWRKRFKGFFDQVSQHIEFRPEIARRLGAFTFTKGLQFSSQGINDFVAKPEQFLAETLNGLSAQDKSALAAVFLRGGALLSPVELTASENQAIARLGGTVAGITESLVSMRDTFVRLATLNDECWIYKHPTIGDALSSILADNPEFVDLYLEGASMDKLLNEVSCGRIGVKGVKVIVPKSRFQLILRRLIVYRKAQDWRDEWKRRSRWMGFLANRCSREFLEYYIKETEDFWKNTLSIGSYLSAIPQFPLLVRLDREGLLPAEKRLIIVDQVKELAVDTPDADFLKVDQIKNFFTREEIQSIMENVKERLLPNLREVLENWKSNKPSNEDPASYYYHLKDALDAFRDYFEVEANASVELIESIEEIDRLAAEEDSDVSTKESQLDLRQATGPVTNNAGRRIFDDLDA